MSSSQFEPVSDLLPVFGRQARAMPSAACRAAVV